MDFSNSSINCRDNAITNFDGALPFTISSWVRVSNVAVSQTIIGKRENVAQYWALFVMNQQFTFVLRDTNGDDLRVVVNDVPLTDNQWYHVTVTYDGSKDAVGANIFIDSVNQPLTTVSDTFTTTCSNNAILGIGATFSASALPLIGTIGYTRIWDKVLSNAEIVEDYNLGKMNKTVVASTNQVFGWRSGEGGLISTNWFFADETGNVTNPDLLSQNVIYADRTTDIP
jgi:hypothetical protein